MLRNKSLLGIFLVPSLLLLVPLTAMQFTREVNWGPGDFVAAWLLMTGAGFAYRLATNRTSNTAYRTAVSIAIAAAFVLVWGNLAVGLIGREDHPANLMYGGVLAVALVGAALARLRPQGMTRALFATAFAQFSVPVVALLVWRPDFGPGVVKVLGLNFVFVLLFAFSALLFRRAARDGRSPTEEATA